MANFHSYMYGNPNLDKVINEHTDDIADLKSKSLPNVTTTDNGKFLMVVNGVWAKAEVPNAHGEEF